MKKKICFPLVVVSTFVLNKQLAAQMVGTDAFIKGNYVEIGIDGLGGFEGTSASPFAGLHPRNSTGFFGFVANPQMDLWTNYDGDFFTPGSPENGWGICKSSSPGGFLVASNNCNYLNEMPGYISSWNYSGGYTSVDWICPSTAGGAANWGIHINYLLGDNDLFYLTTVNITNNTSVAVYNLYYYRNVDADNNEELNGYFDTDNTVIVQGSDSTLAQVIATQPSPWPSYISLLGVDYTNRWKSGTGGFSNRDAMIMWYGTTSLITTPGYNAFIDEAIYLAYKVDSLLPGSTETFRFCTVFSNSAVASAAALSGMNFPGYAHVCSTQAPFPLNNGTPAGGVYSGPGVVGGNTFDPAIAGPGSYTVLYTVTDTAGVAHTIPGTVQVDVCAGLEQHPAYTADDIALYPNPANENAWVDLSKISGAKTLELLDVTGRLILSKQLNNEKYIQLNLDGITKGVYILRIQTNQGPIDKKLMVR